MENNKTLVRKRLKNPFFKKFEKDLLSEIENVGIYKHFNKGEKLIEIGERPTSIPLLTKGAVKISREDSKGDEILLYHLRKGDTCAISFSNCINQHKSIFRGVVEKETECIMLPIAKIEDWLINYKSWRQYIIDSYHFRLTEMVDLINSLAFTNLDHRLNSYLSNQVKIMRDKDLKITHQQIANDLNSSRVVVSRLLKKLENSGKIQLGRNKIIVTNL